LDCVMGINYDPSYGTLWSGIGAHIWGFCGLGGISDITPPPPWIRGAHPFGCARKPVRRECLKTTN